MSRTVCWFSCGAASAVATKLALKERPNAIVAYCEIKEEHPDNKRFLKDCERWFGKEIELLGSDRHSRSIYEVFRKERFLVGPGGAKCTAVLKKGVRKKFQKDGDLQIFGYTMEEQGRADRFIDANPQVEAMFPLIDKGLSKSDCLALLAKEGIELPAMYKLGYNNNNCVGCVKGGAGYWNKIRKDFPEQFEKMSKMERYLGRTVTKHKGKRVFLDQLPKDAGHPVKDLPVSCSFNCEYIEFERKEK